MLAPMPPAVRRRRTVAVLGGLLLTAGLSACAGLGQPAPYDSPGINGLEIPTPSADPADFVATVDNPWLALEPGATWHYDVIEDGRTLGTIDAEVVPGASEVAGLSATAVRTVTDIDGAGDEETRFYAQDVDGNVWLVGADSETGVSWRAGEDGAEAGLAMPADPRLGDGWVTYRLPNLLEATTRVEDQSREMVQTRHEAGTTTRTMYESGAGLVSIEDLDAGWQAVLEPQQ
ncbi:hypothetical protein SAMN05192575_108130 [Nocardioides alpinus]|uniref:Lipoprotein n=1 Tax=Nocardioides alpinus TaxID=748909 RepID=A0A1I1AC51_9ACTN|nr:hypothetical protein [Nocardioides alpinus]SFB35547.1 hypothetical protein SAMN05192575_108130 [Nocardioides alpinus]